MPGAIIINSYSFLTIQMDQISPCKYHLANFSLLPVTVLYEVPFPFNVDLLPFLLKRTF